MRRDNVIGLDSEGESTAPAPCARPNVTWLSHHSQMSDAFSSESAGPSAEGENIDDDDFSTIKQRRPSDAVSFSENADEEEDEWHAKGDYSSRMEEIFSDEEEASEEEGGLVLHFDDDGDEEDSGFLYTGKDADINNGGYQHQLKGILESEIDSDEEILNRSFVSDIRISSGDVDEPLDSRVCPAH